jgi:hypothetical protein
MGLLVLGPRTVVDVPASGAGPRGLRLGPVTPSPARGAASVSFDLPRPGRVRLDLYDVHGRLVRTLVDGPRAAGTHLARWDGRDGAGQPTAAGVYFLRIEAAGETKSGRIALLR